MNLIITCSRHMEEDATAEITGILHEMGDENPEIKNTDMSGILTADTSLDPVSVPIRMGSMLRDEPWTIRYCMRVIPIQEATRADVASISEAAERVISRANIAENDTYRVSVEKRNSDASSSEIIESIARNVKKNKVSLEHADITILVEILGKNAGVSVLRRSEIFSAEKTRRSMNE